MNQLLHFSMCSKLTLNIEFLAEATFNVRETTAVYTDYMTPKAIMGDQNELIHIYGSIISYSTCVDAFPSLIWKVMPFIWAKYDPCRTNDFGEVK